MNQILIKNKKKLRGYISSRKINDCFYPQKIQNLTIRDFAEKKKYFLILSGTEWKKKNSFLMLRSLISNLKNFDGIIFFSVFQISENIDFFSKTVKKILNKKKIICFALEEIEIGKQKELDEIINQLKINKYVQK